MTKRSPPYWAWSTTRSDPAGNTPGRRAYLSGPAATLHNLSNDLGQVGRRAEALVIAEEAHGCYRELTDADHGQFNARQAATDRLIESLRTIGRWTSET